VRAYTADENNNEWSQEHFNEALQNIETVCTAAPPVKLRLFAHSMGTRLLVRAAARLREKRFLSEAAMICPDIDAGLVKHYIRGNLTANGTTTIRLYMSQHDKALAFSQLIHGGYCRLGECADSIASFALNALPLAVQTGHGSIDSNKLPDDFVAKAKKRLQTVDFTVLDSGLIGHKIPVELICSMSYTNTPGLGLDFISQESGQRSRTSRMLSKLTRLQMNPVASGATCLRVVKTAPPDHNGSGDAFKRSESSLHPTGQVQ
jgi:pimeloyl-ACP methyl ester carboxylesterase